MAEQKRASARTPCVILNSDRRVKMASGPRTLNGKVVLQVYMLDNSMKTLLVEPTSTVHVRFFHSAAS